MKYVVVGCGRVGADLARRLSEAGHEVSVLDERPETFSNLPPDFKGRIVEGEVLSQKVLERAGIEEADGLAAVTSSDPHNAVVARIARVAYHVKKVLVRNYDPRWRAMHEAFGTQVISSSLWSAQRLEELLAGEQLRPVFSAGHGEVGLFEITIPRSWEGRALGELVPPEGCRVVGLTRTGRAHLPTGAELLQAGDILHLAATDEGCRTVRGRLEGVRPEEG